MATVCLLVVALLGKFCQFETILTSSLAGDDDLNNEDDGLGLDIQQYVTVCHHHHSSMVVASWIKRMDLCYDDKVFLRHHVMVKMVGIDNWYLTWCRISVEMYSVEAFGSFCCCCYFDITEAHQSKVLLFILSQKRRKLRVFFVYVLQPTDHKSRIFVTLR